MSGNPKQFTDEHAKHKAQDSNCDILYGTDTTLLLDIDSDAALVTFEKQLAMLKELGVIQLTDGYKVFPSKSGNRHVVVELIQTLPIKDRILLQACLGSDLKRELLSYAGLLQGQENPVLLFRPRQKALTSNEPKQLTSGDSF